MTSQKKREKILKKAFAIWEAEGQPHGQDMAHWLLAELLIAEEERTAKKSELKKAKTSKVPVKSKASAKTNA